MKNAITLLSLLFATALHAGPRASTNYSVATEAADAGGRRATSASYTNDGSAGGVVGISTVAAPAETAKYGYLGQLYEVTAVQLAATPTTLHETTTRQFAATATLDDATTTAMLGTDVSWSVVSGPITSISSSGLATAGNLYQDTAATVQGSYGSVAGTLGLTVVNVGTDDFGLYASDGLPDVWQVLYFGQSNLLAAPAADATGSGQNNLFKYTAGLNPILGTSRFVTSVGSAASPHTITFSPRLSDRTYAVEYSLNMTSWLPLTGTSIQDNGQTRTVTDPDATATQKFYRVQISYP